MINREANTSIAFTVYATDRGDPSMSGSATVTIAIIDVNDNAPVFEDTLSNNTVSIRENVVTGTTVGIVRATDEDEQDSVNSDLRYNITGGSGVGIIDVDDITGELILISPLDFEKTSRYDVEVTAVDRGIPPLNATLNLNIVVINDDDNRPFFTLSTYEFDLQENNTVGASVGQVEARDIDPLNRNIGYAITSAVPYLPFSIDSTTGEIFANASINRESLSSQQSPHFTLNVAAFYQDNPSDITSRSVVLIDILDTNEFGVVINTFDLNTIPENTAIGTSIGTVVATDRDPTSNLVYFITVTRDVLRITQDGQIFVNRLIDRESQDLFPQGASFCPPGTPQNTSCLPVITRVEDTTTNDTNQRLAFLFVTDLDDEPPIFSRSLYTLNVSENIPSGSPLPALDIEATDPDFNVVLQYSIPASEGVTAFVIQPTSGLILVNNNLDYETTRDYEFTIRAEDSQGNQATATVVIYIIDENDNIPDFDQDAYFATIPEDYPVNDIVRIVNATDRDSTTNAIITYYITAGNDEGSFNIHPQLGAVSLIKSLDREVTEYYSLTIAAIDSGSPQPLTGTVSLNITIGDVNDHPPRFLETEYRGFVNETASVGDSVLDANGQPLVITYNDPDEGSIVTIRFFGGVPFAVDSTTGLVTVSAPLDFEQIPSYSIFMTIVDDLSLFGAPSTLFVSLVATNDHPPEFERSEYRLTITENSRGGDVVLMVLATDRDGAEVITYEVITDFTLGDITPPAPSSGMLLASGYEEENVTFPFEINSTTGEVRLLRVLDYETAQSWSFFVVASDLGGLRTTAEVSVSVEDENDNPPRFQEHIFEITIPENFTQSRTIPASTAITASDVDSVSQGDLLYIILSGAEGLFELDRNTGYLYVVGALNVRQVYNIQLLVSDGENEDSAVARIRVMDINNNVPVFSEDMYVATIPESVAPNSFVVRIIATDMDLGVFAQITYSLDDSVDAESFYIDVATGDIFTSNSTFNFISQSVYMFEVEAEDGADPPRSARVNVTITLEDVNDNRPMFTEDPFRIDVREATRVGTSIFQLTAVDPDEGIIDAQLFFGLLTENSSFIIEEETGIVRVASELDFDDPDIPTLIVLDISVNDGGDPPLNSTGQLIINITDDNDNVPMFEEPLIQILIPENATINDQAFVIAAVDIDSGTNADLTYTVLSILPEDCVTRFSVDTRTGIVLLKEEVDAEETGEPCTLVVQATDAGVPSRSSQATYVVIITNINEFPPIVSPETLIGQIPENSPNGTFVLQIESTDRDGNTVTYQAVGGATDFFDVSESGRVTVAQGITLDREANETYRISLEVKDDGLPIMRVLAEVVVTLIDENDNEPSFVLDNFIQSVRENHTLFDPPILFVLANDIDAEPNNRITYKFIMNDDNETDYGLFGINTETGAVYLTGSLDYEEEPRFYYLTVEASDGTFTDEADVSIRVLESNDNAPLFLTPPTTIEIAEDAENGSFVIRVEATDIDISVNRKITYSLQDPSGKFGIHPTTGVVSVNGNAQFDFESNVRQYLLRAVATDNAGIETSGDYDAPKSSGFGQEPIIDPNDQPLSSILSLTVVITDVNDNAPQFTETEYTALIIEHDQLPLLVITVQAMDRDEPRQPNSMVRYRIISGDFGRFQIDSIRGEIRTVPPIDRETLDVYELQVQAYDLGIPEQNTTETVIITVVDTNDNQPLFQQRRYVGVVNENSPQGTSVVTITAIDPDNIAAGLNYTILDISGFFEIGQLTGVVSTSSKLLDREIIQNVTFNVQAEDEDGISATTEVFVAVADVNDQVPTFEEESYSFTITENTAVGDVFAAIVATDLDIGSNAIPNYFLDGGDQFFDVDPLQGNLMAAEPLCFNDDTLRTYSLQLVARDSGMSSFSSSTSVNVSVFKENNHPPVFVQPSYVSRLDEEAPAGTEVISELRTTDQDICSGSPVFEIIEGNLNGTFTIDMTSGRIVLNRNLTRDDLAFTLTLRATDTDNYILANLSSEVTLIVLIGQLLPITMVVEGGLTVPTISRFSTEEYQQDVWIADASVVRESPVVTYILGDLEVEATIPVQEAPALQVTAQVIAQNSIFPDSPQVSVGFQVQGEGFEKASVESTNFFVEVSSNTFPGAPLQGNCTTQRPSSACIATVDVPPEWFSTAHTADVTYTRSSNPDVVIVGSVKIVARDPCPRPTSRPQVIVELPHRVIYPGQEFNVRISAQTEYQTGYFLFTCDISEGLEMEELVSYTNGFSVTSALSDRSFSLAGLNHLPATPDIGTYDFELMVRVSLDEDAGIPVNSILNFTCNIDHLVNRIRQPDFSNMPATHLGYNDGECDLSRGQVLVARNNVVGLFPYGPSATLINTAVLNGQTVSKMFNVRGLLASGEFTNEVKEVTCMSINDRVLKVNEDCSQVFLNGNETGGIEMIQINVSTPYVWTLASFRVWYPMDIQVTLGEEELNPISGLFVRTDGVCAQAFESTAVAVETVLSSGNERGQVVFVTSFVTDILESSDDSILVIENNQGSYSIKAKGLAPGSAYVQFTDFFGNVYESPSVTITSSSVTVEDINLSLHSDLIPRSFIPVIPGIEYLQTTIVALESDFSHLNVEVDILAEAVLSNGRNFELSESLGLSFSSINPDIIEVSDSDIVVRGSGMGRILLGELVQADCQFINITTSEFIEVALNPIVEIVVTLSETVLALESDSDILELPFQTTYEVELVHQDGTRVVVSTDPRLSFSTIDPLSFTDGVLDVASLNITQAGSVTFNAVYSYGGNMIFSASLNIEVVGIEDIEVSGRSYPYHTSSSDDLLLERFNNSGAYQQAELILTATLTDGNELDLSKSEFVVFSLSDTSLAAISDGVVTPSRSGNLTIFSSLDSRSLDNLVLMITDEAISAEEIISFSLPVDQNNVLTDTVGQTLSPELTLRFSDGTYISDFLSQRNEIVSTTVSFVGSADPSIAVDEETGTVTIQRNSVSDVTFTVTLRDNVTMATLDFSVNLLPQAGEIDYIGNLRGGYNLGDPVSIDLYLNTGGQRLTAFEGVIYYDSTVLRLPNNFGTSTPFVSPGNDIPASSEVAVSYNDNPGSIRVGGIIPEGINGSSLHIVGLFFSALTSDVPYFYVVTNTVVDEDLQTIGAPTPKLSLPTVFNSNISAASIPPSSTRCEEPPCSPAECLNITSTLVPGDTNADCVFDLLDVVFLQQVIADLALLDNDLELLPSQLEALDSDRNGDVNTLDVRFLIRARMGSYPLISDLTLRPIGAEFSDCRLTINMTLLSYLGAEVDGFAYLGLFHEAAEFQTQFDSTNFNIGQKVSIDFPVGSFGGWILPQYFGEGVYGIQTEPGPIAQSDIGLVVVYGTFDPSGVPTLERTQILLGHPSIPLAYDSLNAMFTPVGGQPAVNLQYPAFNPTQYFDNSFPAELCYNIYPPMFDPALGQFIITSQREDVTGVLRSVSATDQDAPNPSGMILFSLQDVVPPGVIDINPETGDIFVATSLDRETSSSIEATVVATDQGPHIFTRLTDTRPLVVNLVDVNDNPPRADQSSYTVGVLEDVPLVNGISAPVFQFSGSDRDVDPVNNGLSSSINVLEDGSVSELFVAQPGAIVLTGNGSLFTVTLHLIDNLDREVRDRYDITVILRDSGLSSLNSSVDIQVRVVDANDLRPNFTTPSQVGIRENNAPGTVVIQVGAVDNDIGVNAEFNFTINSVFIADDSGAEGPNPVSALELFSIDPLSGALTVNRILDREGNHSFVISILAEEINIPVQLLAFQSLWVMVCEMNDNTPLFAEALYQAFVPENSNINSFVTDLLATDADLGPFCDTEIDLLNSDDNQVRYEILTKDVPFYIDDISGSIFVNGSLDFEDTLDYSMVIEVTDLGIPPRSSTTNLTITVTDENDNSPVLNNDTYFNLAIENSSISSVVIDFISATDADSGDNAVIAYRLIGVGSEDFNVSSSGLITIARELDRERQAVYTLTVVAYNPNNLDRNDTAIVTIEVIDINDSPPVFSQASYTAEVSENSPEGSLALTVIATDSDLNAHRDIRYRFDDDYPLFEIDPISGDIRTTGGLCTFSNTTYDLSVSAEDHPGGELRFTTQVNVTIIIYDDNSFDPVFSRREYAVVVPDGIEAGIEILIVEASDQDRCSVPLSYSITSPSGLFMVDSINGRINTSTVLNERDASVYYITVSATDSGTDNTRVGTTTVIVLVGETVPVEFTNSIGYAVENPRKISEESDISVYQQVFDFFYGIDSIGSPVQFEAQFGKNVRRQQQVEVSRLPPTEANALLLTPVVTYDRRVIQMALGAVDEFRSSRVEETTVFVSANVTIENQVFTVSSTAETELTLAIVNLELPQAWFMFDTTETRTVTVSYGVVDSPATVYNDLVTLTPEPDFEHTCSNSTGSLLLLQVPSYPVYNDQVVPITVRAQRSSSYYLSSFALQCEVDGGLEFIENPVSTPGNWATRYELDNLRSQISFTASRLDANVAAYDFEEVASLSVRVTSISKESISVTCYLLEAVDNDGDFERYPDVFAVDRDDCRLNVGTVAPTEDILVGAIPLSSQTVVINDAILSGTRREVYPSVVSIVLSAAPRFDNLLSGGLSNHILACSSSDDSILQVEPRCGEVFVDGREQSGSESIRILLNIVSLAGNINFDLNAFPIELEYQVWYPDIPLPLRAVSDILSPVEGWTVQDPPGSGNCVQAYQETDIEAIATFKRIQEVGVKVRVEGLLNLVVDNPTIARVQGTKITGLRPGVVSVQAVNNLRINNRIGFVSVNIESTPQRAVEMDTSIASDFSISAPSSLPYSGPSPFSAYLDSSLSYPGQSANLVSTVIFSDATRLQLSEDTGISFSSLNSSILDISGDQLTVYASTSEDLLRADWSSVCDGSLVLSRPVDIDIALIVPVIRVTVTDTIFIHPSDPLSALDTSVSGVATRTSVTVELVYIKDGEEIRTVDATHDPMTRYSFSEDSLFTVSPSTDGSSTMTLEATATSVSVVANLVVGYWALEETQSVTLYLGYSSSIEVTTRPYPAYDGSEDRVAQVLHLIGNTGQYQQARMLVSLNVVFPSESGVSDEFDISSHPLLTYTSSQVGVATVSSEGIVFPQASGNGVVLTTTFFGLVERFAVNVRSQNAPIQIISVEQLQLSSGVAIVGSVEEVVSTTISAVVRFSDGTGLDEVFTSSGQVIPELFSIVSNNQDVVRVDSFTGRLTILNNTAAPVSITLNANQDHPVSETLEFFTNLEPGAGDLDVGMATGRPIPPVEQGETFDVPLRLNFDLSGSSISALEISVAYSGNLLELVSIAPGDFWTSDSLFESSLREFSGYVYLGGLVNSQPSVLGTESIALLTFRALNGASGLAALNAQVTKLLDRSSPPVELFVPISPAATVGVFVSSPETQSSLPPLQLETALTALYPTVAPCSNGVPVNGREMGDVNGDCIFNLDDVLEFQRGGCAAYPNVDVDFDGVCNDDKDLNFLLRANFRIVQFVQEVSVTPVSVDNCFLSIDARLSGRGSPVPDGARTSLLIGLFHRDAGFQQEVDATSIFLDNGEVVEFIGEMPASTNGGFFEAAPHSSSGTYRAILRTSISQEDVGLLLLQARVDVFDTVASPDRTQVIYGQDSIPLYFPESTSITITHPRGLQIPFESVFGFSPLLFFNQTFSSPDCINFNRPVFFPDLVQVEVYENFEVGNVVATVFANDSDAGPNADVMYSFSNVSSNIISTFQINATTGEVVLLSTLDREEFGSYFIVVNAVDRGVLGSLSGVGELVITILDVNDREPEFSHDPFTLPSVPEDATIGTVVGSVSATDEDQGENGTVMYRLLEPTYEFDINNETGEVFVIAELDYETAMFYTLIVEAYDGGVPSLSSNATVLITVDPVNDNVPDCSPSSRLALVPEDQIVGDAFFLIYVSDADLGADHSVLNYSLSEPNDNFGVRKLDDMTAALYATTDEFDRAVTRDYSLTVLVSDVDGQQCSVNISVVVAEPSRFGFSIQGGGFFTGPVQRRRGDDEFSRNIVFFRNSFSDIIVRGELGDSYSDSDRATRSTQPLARIDGVLREDNVWYDWPVINAVAQLRDNSFGHNVDFSIVHIEIYPENVNFTVSPQEGPGCRGDPVRDYTGVCSAEVDVPLSWFSDYTSVHVMLVGGNLNVDLGSVNLRTPPTSTFIPENLIAELPSYTLYPGSEFMIWIGAPSSLNVQAFQFEITLPRGITANNLSDNSNWVCDGNEDSSLNKRSYVCFRVSEEEEDLSPLGTQRFFAIQARVQDSAIDISDNEVAIETVSLVAEYGSVISVTTPAQVFSRSGLANSPGSLSLEEVQVRGIFGFTRQPELINTAPLDGIDVTANISSLLIFNRIRIMDGEEYGVEDMIDISCSSQSVEVTITGNCVIDVSDAENCSETAIVDLMHVTSNIVFPVPMRVWCFAEPRIAVTDNELNAIPSILSSNCSTSYQQAEATIYGIFKSGRDSSSEVDVTHLLSDSLMSDDASVAVSGTTIIGLDIGQAEIGLSNFPADVSVEVTVSADTVEVYHLYPTIFTTLAMELEPSSFTSESSLTVSAVIEQDFKNVGIEGRVAAYVYFTDGARQDIPLNTLFLDSLSPSVAVIDGNLVQSAGPGIAEIVFTWTPDSCGSQQTIDSARAVTEIEVTVPLPVRIEVELSDREIAGETQGAVVSTLAFSSTLSVVLVYDNDLERRLTVNEFTYYATDSLLVNESTDSLTILANLTSSRANGMITITYGTEVQFSSSFNVSILDVVSIQAALLPYPDPQVAPEQEITLFRVADTSYKQQAQIISEAILSNGESVTITDVTYDGGFVNISSNGIVTPISPGVSGVITVSSGSLSAESLLVTVQDLPQNVIEIQEMRLEDISATESRVIADVLFEDSTVINDVINFDSDLANLLSFEITPSGIATFDPATWTMEIVSDHYDNVVLTATANGGSVVAGLNFTANLDPQLGELDLGQPEGIPQPPVATGEQFTVDIRANTGGVSIGAVEIVVSYDKDSLELMSVESVLPAFTVIRANAPLGEIHLSFLVSTVVSDSIPTVAQVTFQAQGVSNVTSITSTVIVLRDDDLQPISTEADSASRLDVLVRSSSRRRRSVVSEESSPRSRRQTGDVLRLGDINVDGDFNILDAVWVSRELISGGPPSNLILYDANKDGVVSVADAIFLSRISAGLLPFLDTASMTSVAPGTNCRLDVTVDLVYNDNGPFSSNTFVFVILSYPDASGLISLSQPDFGGPGDDLDRASTIFETYPLMLDGSTYSLSLFTAIDQQLYDVGLSVVFLTSDHLGQTSSDRFASFFRQRGSVFVNMSSLVPQLKEIDVLSQRDSNIGIDGADIGDEVGFSPFDVFTNPTRSDYCLFDGSLIEHVVREDQVVGEVFYNISALDSNFPSTNEQYTVTTVTPNGPFNLSLSGGLALSAPLDYEVASQYTLIVQAVSVGGGYVIGETTLNLIVFDVNDFAPSFIDPENYFVELIENRTPDETVDLFNVSAFDRDSGVNGEFYFSIDGGNPDQLFDINNITGSIYLVKELDREPNGQVVDIYMLIVTVTDLGDPVLSSSTLVNVSVLDINDNTPQFDEEDYVVFIPENFYINESETFMEFQIVAVDLDAGENGTVTLELIALDDISPFELDDDGFIIVTGPLDRETTLSYGFIVTATDGGVEGLSQSTNLTIIVSDINDNPPVFSADNAMMIMVEEDSLQGIVLTTITAMDVDDGNNSAITYTLKDSSTPFSIDTMSGAITVSGPLDVGSRSSYLVTIVASDRGVPPMTAEHDLMIGVIEGQVVSFNIGSYGYLEGDYRRTDKRSYGQNVGHLFGEDIGTSVSVSAKINTATSGGVDQVLVPNQGDEAASLSGALLHTDVKHSLRTVTTFIQVYDSRGAIARSTAVRVSITSTPQLRELGGPSSVDGTCITSDDLGFCISHIPLPDEWFARSETNTVTDKVSVWINFDSERNPGELIGELVVENSPAYGINFADTRIELVAPSHPILPGKNFSVEVYVVSPLDRDYDQVESTVVWDEMIVSLTGLEYDADLWSCCK